MKKRRKELEENMRIMGREKGKKRERIRRECLVSTSPQFVLRKEKS